MINLVVLLGTFGATEIILIIAVVLLLFGGRKIPELMKGLGQGLHEFKRASKGENKKTEEVVKDEIVKEEKK